MSKHVDMKRYIPAIDKLIKHYKQWHLWEKPEGMFPCPLCEVNGQAYYNINSTRCCYNKCPWVVFTRDTCMNNKFKGDRVWTRLRRLNKWKKLIEREAS